MAQRCQALEGLRVLDLATDHGHLCGKLLADLGAEVIKVEPPEGDASRRRPPFAEKMSNPVEAGLVFHYFNANKKGIVLDLSAKEGQREFRSLATTTDMVIESFVPGQLTEWGLGFSDLQAVNPRLVLCSITGFGQSGPYSRYAAEDTTAFAMGGVMSVCGDADKEPLGVPYDACFQQASVYAAYGALLALVARDRIGTGQHVDVSAQEVQAFQQWLVVNYAAVENILGRAGSRSARAGSAPHGPYPCKDGYAEFFIMSPAHWRRLVEWMGSPEPLTDPMWENRYFRSQNVDVIIPFIIDFAARYTKKELFEEAARRHLPIAPINKPPDFVSDVQVKTLAFVRTLDHPVLGQYKTLGFPYRLSATPCRVNRPAPLLGQHNQEVLNQTSGVASVTPSCFPAVPCPNGRLPLQGFRVLDLGIAVAGPALSYLLAQAGAEVIRVESEVRQQRGKPNPDPNVVTHQLVTYGDHDRLKKQTTINLGTEEGRATFLELVAISDVVVESFSPRVMRQWRLDYCNLRAKRPDIIMTSLPAYGSTGLRAEYIGAASTTSAFTGLYYWWSYRGDPVPAAPTANFSDYAIAGLAATAVSASLVHRQLTGEGQYIELPHIEALATFMGPAYLQYLINGQIDEPLGNRSNFLAPQGCYPCKGRDEWCVISVRGNAQWQSLCRLIDDPRLAEDPRFATAENRLKHQDELDKRIMAWTREHTAFQAMRTLQKAGVAAGMVQNGEDMVRDPHLRQRQFLVEINHPKTGPIEYPGAVFRLSGTPLLQGPWAEMGQHNGEVFENLMGMPKALVQELAKKGALR